MRFYCPMCNNYIYLDKIYTVNKCPKCYHDLIPIWV